MTPEQRTRQQQAIHIDYARKIREGIYAPLAKTIGDGCHLWATEVLGRLVPSLKTCSDYELNILRDTLNGKDSKILERLKAEFDRCRISAPQAWIAACARSGTFSSWRGKTLSQLPVSQQYLLLKMLERRKAGQHAAPAPQFRQDDSLFPQEETA